MVLESEGKLKNRNVGRVGVGVRSWCGVRKPNARVESVMVLRVQGRD